MAEEAGTPQEPPKPPKPATPATPAPLRAWQRTGHAPKPLGTVPSTKPPVRSHLVRWVVVVIACLIGIVGAFLYFVSGWTKPEFFSLTIREYTSPLLPINPLVYEDSRILSERFEKMTVEYNAQDHILNVLGGLRTKQQPLVVHLSALARWRDGKVYLLGSNADPDRTDTWVSFHDVLQKIRDCESPHKLLVLDIMRSSADERFGFFSDDIAGKVQAELALEKKLPFFVLCACSAGQSSQVAEELAQSIFAFYLDEGLRGYADGYGLSKGKKDRYISVLELADFVTRRVDRWAWTARGVRQTPVLYGKETCTDFPLAYNADGARASAAKITPHTKYPVWLRKDWDARDQWRAELSTLGPGIVRYFESLLLKTEQRWRGEAEEEKAGAEQNRLQKGEEDQKSLLSEQKQRILATPRPPKLLPASLPAPVGDQEKQVQAFAIDLRGLLKALDTPLKAEDKSQKEELDKKLKAMEKDLDEKPLEAAMALFEVAVTVPVLGQSQVFQLQKFQQNLKWKVREENRFVQTVFLDRLELLDEAVRTNGWPWDAATVQQAVLTVRDAEAALAAVALDPAVFSYVKTLLENADQLRRVGEGHLFNTKPPLWTKASQALTEAGSLYRRAAISARDLTVARTVRDRAMGLLTSTAPALLAQPNERSPEAATWRVVMTNTQRLADALEQLPAAGGPGGEPEGALELEQDLKELERQLDAKVRGLLKIDMEGRGEDYVAGKAFLDSAWLGGERREKLWAAGQKLSLQLHDKIRAVDDLESQGEMSTSLPVGSDHGKELIQLQKKTRARQALDMIKLAGFTESGPLEREYKVALEKADDEGWQGLMENLSRVWPGLLLTEFLKSGEQNLPRAERLARVLSPFDLRKEGSREVSYWTQNPTLEIYRRDLARFWQWLESRYQTDSDALSEDNPFRAVYRDWADDYRKRGTTIP